MVRSKFVDLLMDMTELSSHASTTLIKFREANMELHPAPAATATSIYAQLQEADVIIESLVDQLHDFIHSPQFEERNTDENP